jgi:hypothetical protein
MIKFELVFRYEDYFLVPSLLPKDTPAWATDGRWEADGVLHLELRYRVLLDSVMNRFIARRHHQSLPGKQWWRYGMAIRVDAHEALIFARSADAKIELSVRGPKAGRPQFVGGILGTLLEVDQGLGGELWVVLDGGEAVKYSDLLVFANAGRATIERVVDQGLVELDVREALDLVDLSDERELGLENDRSFHYHKHEHKHMETKTEIHDSAVFGSAFGDQAKATVVDSFKTGSSLGEVSSLVEILRQQANVVVEKLPPEKRESAKDDLNLLVQQAERYSKGEGANRKWYSVSAQGLLDASEWVGEFTGNIAGTLGKLGKLFWPDFELHQKSTDTEMSRNKELKRPEGKEESKHKSR